MLYPLFFDINLNNRSAGSLLKQEYHKKFKTKKIENQMLGNLPFEIIFLSSRIPRLTNISWLIIWIEFVFVKSVSLAFRSPGKNFKIKIFL